MLITVVDREELQQPAFHTMGNLEYPELHEESVGNLASIRAIVKLMAVTGVSDFSMMDIFKPESKRTINNLSAIINFSKYKYAPCFRASCGTQFVSDQLYSGRRSKFSLIDKIMELFDRCVLAFWKSNPVVMLRTRHFICSSILVSPLCKSVEGNGSVFKLFFGVCYSGVCIWKDKSNFCCLCADRRKRINWRNCWMRESRHLFSFSILKSV